MLFVFVIGILLGGAVTYFLINSTLETRYVTLMQDYKIEGVGVLHKGAKLKIDEGMSEGFTRYILFLNLKGGNTKLSIEKGIVPYWLSEIDTLNPTTF